MTIVLALVVLGIAGGWLWWIGALDGLADRMRDGLAVLYPSRPLSRRALPRRLLRAAARTATVGVSGTTLLPTRIDIAVNPDDLAPFGDALEWLAQDIATALRKKAEAGGWIVPDGPEIVITPDEERPLRVPRATGHIGALSPDDMRRVQRTAEVPAVPGGVDGGGAAPTEARHRPHAGAAATEAGNQAGDGTPTEAGTLAEGELAARGGNAAPEARSRPGGDGAPAGDQDADATRILLDSAPLVPTEPARGRPLRPVRGRPAEPAGDAGTGRSAEPGGGGAPAGRSAELGGTPAGRTGAATAGPVTDRTAQVAPAHTLHLRLVSGHGAEGDLSAILTPDQPPLVLGRSRQCDLRVRDRHASGRHCAFSVDAKEGTLTVEDLGSTNGTFVGGNRIRRASLRPGEVLRIGDSSWRVAVDGVTTDPGATR